MFKDVNIHIKKSGLWKPVYEDGFWYLHFPGTAGSYVEARDIHDFEIGDEDAEIEVDLRPNLYGPQLYIASVSNFVTDNSNGWLMRVHGNSNLEFSISDGTNRYQRYSGLNQIEINEWGVIKGEYIFSNGETSISIDGIVRSVGNYPSSPTGIFNDHSLIIGGLRASSSAVLEADIRYFRFNDEYFDFSEGSGDSIVSNFGTVMDIKGDVEWRYQEPIKNVKLYTGLGWKDLIEDEGWYLHFPGTAGSYVEARSSDSMEIGSGSAEIEVEFRTNEISRQVFVSSAGDAVGSSGYSGYMMALWLETRVDFRLLDGIDRVDVVTNNAEVDYESWNTVKGTYNALSNEADLYVNNILKASRVFEPYNGEINNYWGPFLGTLRPNYQAYNLHGDIRYFRFNDEEFLMNEGQGTTITGSKGTVMDILGDVEWRRDPSVMKVKIKKTPYVRLSDDTLGQFSEMSMNPMSKLNISNYYEIKFRRIAGGATLFDNIKVFDQGDYNQFRLSIRPFGELISRVSLYVYDGISSTDLSSEYTTRDWSVVRVEVSDDELHLYVDGEFKESMDLSNPIETTDPYFLSNVFYFFNYNYRNEYPSTIDISYIEIDGERFDFVGGGDTVLGSGGSVITLEGNYTWH